MRILIYGINYAPELTGIGKYTGEMAAWMTKNGHDVHMITAMPYYPVWKVSKEYSRKWWHSEIIDGVRITRCPLYVPKKITSLTRIIHEFSFLASAFPAWFKTLFTKRYDAVICVSPPFHMGFLPLLYSKLRKVPFIDHIQDLQIDAAKDLGMIKNKTLLNLMMSWEKFILKNSSVVSTISDGMRKKIEAKGIGQAKCVMFPNWVDETAIRPLGKGESLRQEFGLTEHDKVILYSGNLGEKQGLESIIHVAEALSHRKDLRFLIVGSGGAKERLENLVKDAQLTNISFHPLQPYEKMSALLATADLHLVLQKKSASDLVMPSKLCSILAAGGCALVTAVPGSSLYNVISKHDLGILVEPENTDALKLEIEKSFTVDLDVFRSNARSYAENYLSRDSIMKNWELELQKLTNTVFETKEIRILRKKIQMQENI